MNDMYMAYKIMPAYDSMRNRDKWIMDHYDTPLAYHLNKGSSSHQK